MSQFLQVNKNIKLIGMALVVLIGLISVASVYAAKIGVKSNLNGIQIPENYKDWKVLSSSHRTDNNTMRIILGNEIAIEASRSGKTNPWPQGTVIGKLVFKQKTEENWSTAIAPDEFVHAEFMFKDAKLSASNATGWAWARWLGKDQVPYGNEQDLDQSCIACHAPVKGKDWVFSTPITLP